MEVVQTVPVDSDGDGTPDVSDPDDDNDGTPDDPNVTPPPDVQVTTLQETWNLSTAPQTTQLGVVIVIDVSVSMEEDGKDIASAMADLGKAMSDAGFTDTCFAVAEGKDGDAMGKLYTGPHGISLCVKGQSSADLATKIAATFNSLSYGYNGHGELPDRVTYEMLTNQAVIDYNTQATGGSIFSNKTANAWIVLGDENSCRQAYSTDTYHFTVAGNSTSGAIDNGSEAAVRAQLMSTQLPNGNYETWFNTQSMVTAFQNFYGPISPVYNFIGDTPGSNNAQSHEADVAALKGLYMNINDLRADATAFTSVIKDQLTKQIITKLTWVEVFDVSQDVCGKLAYKVEVDGVDQTAHAQRIGARRFHIDSPYNQGSTLKITYVKASDPLCI